VEVTAFSYSYFIKIHNSLLANQSGKFNLKNRIEHVLKWYLKNYFVKPSWIIVYQESF